MQTNYLTQIQQGMKVFDRQHHEIGKVERVQLSDDDPSTPEVEAATPGDLRHRDKTLLDIVAEAFAPDELPEEVQERLLQQGFVRLDSNVLFDADRYITPDQIMSVSGDTVTLSVTRDELMKRH